MFLLEKTFIKQHMSLNARVFISAGGLEGSAEPEWMISNMKLFGDQLGDQHYTGFIRTSQVFENETHISVVPAAVCRMIRVLYGEQKK
jgi:hypothetical protein